MGVLGVTSHPEARVTICDKREERKPKIPKSVLRRL
jgi:hypothetical protein